MASNLAQFDEESRKELVDFIENEQKRQQFQGVVHQYTDICFDKCIPKITKSMDSSEQTCLANCVERFLDTTNTIVSRLQKASR